MQSSGRLLRVWVKGMAGKWGNTPDVKNVTTHRVFHVWVVVGSGKGVGVWETTQTRRTQPQGCVLHAWVVEGGGLDREAPEHDLVVVFWCSR